MSTVENLPSPSDRSDHAMIAQIKRLMKSQPGPSVILTITPGVAQWILDNLNVGNRPRGTRNIQEFAGYMTHGDWKLSGDTLKFSTLYFRDGQHRLIACIKSGCPFTTHCVFGLDDTIFPFLDRTRTRSTSDAMAIHGVHNSASITKMVRWLEMFRTNTVTERITLVPNETIEAYSANYDADRLQESRKIARKVFEADATPIGLGGALHYLFFEKNPALADEFFDAWATRSFNSGRMRPIRKASEYLATLHNQTDGRVHDVVRAAIWVIAWNLVVAKQIGTKPSFEWRTGKHFPSIKG